MSRGDPGFFRADHPPSGGDALILEIGKLVRHDIQRLRSLEAQLSIRTAVRAGGRMCDRKGGFKRGATAAGASHF